VNEELATTITVEVDRLLNQVRTATVGEVKDALRTTNDTITQSCSKFNQQLTGAADTTETQMKATVENFNQEVDRINMALCEKLRELESKQREFFAFEGAKHFSFGFHSLLV
jgi:t-SNARE complex subunit (syntaxin)